MVGRIAGQLELELDYISGNTTHAHADVDEFEHVHGSNRTPTLLYGYLDAFQIELEVDFGNCTYATRIRENDLSRYGLQRVRITRTSLWIA